MEHTKGEMIFKDRGDGVGIIEIGNKEIELKKALKTALDLLEEHQGDAMWYLKGHYNKFSQALKSAEGS